MVLLYASMFNDVSIVINISGRFNLERGVEGPLGKDFLQRIKQKGFIDVRNKRGEQSNAINLMVLSLASLIFVTRWHFSSLSYHHLLKLHGDFSYYLGFQNLALIELIRTNHLVITQSHFRSLEFSSSLGYI